MRIMSHTPVSAKPQLSSSLKERLKRCGRYHVSPKPVVNQQDSFQSPFQENKQVQSISSDALVSPCSKRQCMGVDPSSLCRDNNVTHEGLSSFKSPMLSSTSPYKSPMSASTATYTSPMLQSDNSTSIGIPTNNQTDSHVLNQTPSIHKTRSELSKVKRNKLAFDDDTKEADKQELSKPEVNSETYDDRVLVQTSASINFKIGSEADLDLSDPVLKSKLMKELSLKEEDLRKLKMVKMYREKNNLDELQVLIDKWRDVSQQALQDLHASVPEPRPSLTELINHLGIEHQLVHFNADDDETFY